MTMYKNLTTVCAAVVLAFGLAACGGGDDEETAEAPVVEMPEPMEPAPDPGPTDMEETQMAAADAAAAAMTAAGNADMAASGAEDATMNIATLQTNGTAADSAAGARMYADTAMAAYMDAKAASDAAAAATTSADAEAAWRDAVTAQEDAEEAAMSAVEMADAAMEAAMTELHIDGTMKTVGGITIDADSDSSTTITGSGKDAKTVITGLLAGLNPKGTGAAITGNARTDAVADDLGTATDESAKAIPYKQAAAERTFSVGTTVDSADDTARLMIVNAYPGTNMVRVYSDLNTAPAGTKAGHLTIEDSDTPGTDVNNVALRSEGKFVRAGAADAGALVHTLEIASDAKPVEVFSYVDPTDDLRKYVTLLTTSTTGAVTTYTYSGADITAAAAGPDSATDDDANPDEAQVAVAIPGPEAYEHLHFGVWAGLGAANAAGAQDVADMGIGFIQSIGDGPTGADLPNAGSATYTGNWVAVVLQGAGDDSGALEHGGASLTANFEKSTLRASLTGLATINSKITGNGFSAETASVAASNAYGLTPGSFDGSMSGGFYGSEGAEAGGVFDFDGDDNGAFRGAFGGAKDDPS